VSHILSIMVATVVSVVALGLGGIRATGEFRELAYQVLPAWMQGVGTLIASFYAYRAYAHWTKTERAKAKSVEALSALLSARLAIDAIRASRTIMSLDAAPEDVCALWQVRLATGKALFLGEASGAENLRRVYEKAIVADALFSEETGRLLREIHSIGKEVVDAVGRAQTFSRGLMEADGDEAALMAQLVREALASIGIELTAREQQPGWQDAIDRQLDVISKKLEILLMPHITFSEWEAEK